MTNEELIREKVFEAFQLLTEVIAYLPPPHRRLAFTLWGNNEVLDCADISAHNFGLKKTTTWIASATCNGSEADARGWTLDFSQEEINKMPKLKDGKTRITRDGLYQIRYRRDGYNVQFTAKEKKVAMERFREWVKSVNRGKKSVLPKKTEYFGEFAEQFFQTVKRINVDEETYKGQYRTYQLHIQPKISKMRMKQIGVMKCQEILSDLLDKGLGRTCESVRWILNEIFNAALGEKLITENPMKFVKVPKHVRKKGKRLTQEEVAFFIEACKSSRYQKAFMVFLYTGIRRNELYSAVFSEDFVTVENGKRQKGQPQTWRKIPIAPALKEYLPLLPGDIPQSNDTLSGNFKKIMPKNSLKDLRHTFSTRAQECGIAKELVDVWTAHVDNKDRTSAVYTHFSEEFQLEQIKKLVF